MTFRFRKNVIWLLLLLIFPFCLPSDGRVRAQLFSNTIYIPHVRSIENPLWMGPDGGSIVSLAPDLTDPDSNPDEKTLYAGTLTSGVYKSVNGGQTWKSASTGLSNLFIDSLTVDPVDGRIVYAGTHGSGVYKSTDGGLSWRPINNGIALNTVVYTLAVNPGNHNLVYAGTRIQNTVYHGILYKSTDGGESWENVLDFSDDWVYSLAINPSSPDTVLAAIHTRGPVISYDYGNANTWNDCEPPSLDSSISGRWYKGRAVAFDPRGWVDRSYYTAWHDGMVSYSSDGGASWKMAGGDLGTSHIFPNGISVNPARPDVVYLAAHESDVDGILRSDDAGRTWSGAGLHDKTVYSVAALGGETDVLVAGTFMDGLHRSVNGGASWSYSMSGIYDSKVTGMVFPGGANILASTQSGGGIFRSTDGGKSWSRFNDNLDDAIINGLVRHPANPNILFALTNSAGIKRIDLGTGTTWTTAGAAPMLTDAPEIDLKGPLAPPAQPDQVYEDSSLITGEIKSGNADALIPPMWQLNTASVSAPVLSMIFSQSNPNIAYAGTNGGGVFSTRDGGENWSYAGQPGGLVRDLAVHPTDDQVIYAATNRAGALKISTDGGASWNDITLPDSTLELFSVTIWPKDPGAVYVGTGNGLFRYKSNTWTAAGLPGVPVFRSGYNPGFPDRLFAGTDRGVFLTSTIDGAWLPLAQDFYTKLVVSLNFDPNDPSDIFIGTEGRGTLRVFLP